MILFKLKKHFDDVYHKLSWLKNTMEAQLKTNKAFKEGVSSALTKQSIRMDRMKKGILSNDPEPTASIHGKYNQAQARLDKLENQVETIIKSLEKQLIDKHKLSAIEKHLSIIEQSYRPKVNTFGSSFNLGALSQTSNETLQNIEDQKEKNE